MKKCLLIPGNPAVADHYKTWIQEIESMNAAVDMTYATSYVLFDRKLNGREYNEAMTEHYERTLLALSPGEKIVIVAHSVGSYFAIRLLKKHSEKIEKIIIMFSYIGYSTIASLRFTGMLTQIDRFFPLVETVSRCKGLMRRWEGDVDSISSEELTACLRFGVRQCAFFKNHKLGLDDIVPNRDKIHFVYGDNDRWCPPVAVDLLRNAASSSLVTLPHDFIVTKKHRLSMAEEIMPHLA